MTKVARYGGALISQISIADSGRSIRQASRPALAVFANVVIYFPEEKMSISPKDMNKIQRIRKKRRYLGRGISELNLLLREVILRPEEVDEVKSLRRDLEEDIAIGRRIVASILDGKSSLPAPSETDLNKMKEAVKELEKINRQDDRTRAILGTVTDLATTLGGVN